MMGRCQCMTHGSSSNKQPRVVVGAGRAVLFTLFKARVAPVLLMCGMCVLLVATAG